MHDSERKQRLEALQVRYAERLQDDVQTVLAEVDEMSARAGAADMAELEALCDALQRIADSAGTFGHESLSETCGNVARQIRDWLDGDLLPAPYTLAALLPRLQQGAATLPERGDASVSAAPGETLPTRLALLGEDRGRGEALAASLDALGYTCRTFAMHEVAASIAWAPDVLVIDEQGMSRQRWCDEWIAWPAPRPHLLVMGGDDAFTARLEAVRLGAEGYFMPPLDVSLIDRRVQQLLPGPVASPLRVLIVDDDIELAEHYRLVLAGVGIESWVVNAPADALTVLREERPDLALVDTRLPGCSGRDLVQVMRLEEAWRHLPVVYLAAGSDVSKLALTRSGDDFLGKPVDDDALVATVVSHAQRARRSRQAMGRDGMTGVLTYEALQELLEVEFARARRSGAPTSLALIDLDRLGALNARHGHTSGDYAIRQLAERLTQQLRFIDHVGRYTGGAFCVVLPHCDPEDAQRAIERIRLQFQAQPLGEHADIDVTFSAGVASLHEAESVESGLDVVGRRLYRAKLAGRNCVLAEG